jgi:hypothetical protein
LGVFLQFSYGTNKIFDIPGRVAAYFLWLAARPKDYLLALV